MSDDSVREVAKVYRLMEQNLDATITAWERRLQHAGWSGSFGMSCREYIRDELYAHLIDECPEIGRDLVAELERR